MMIMKSSGASNQNKRSLRDDDDYLCADCGHPHCFQRAILVIEVREPPNLRGCAIYNTELSSGIDSTKTFICLISLSRKGRNIREVNVENFAKIIDSVFFSISMSHQNSVYYKLQYLILNSS